MTDKVFTVIATQELAGGPKSLPVNFSSIELAREYIKSQPLHAESGCMPTITDYTIYASPTNDSIKPLGILSRGERWVVYTKEHHQWISYSNASICSSLTLANGTVIHFKENLGDIPEATLERLTLDIEIFINSCAGHPAGGN